MATLAMANFNITRDLLEKSEEECDARASGASTPLFMPVAHTWVDDAENEGACTPVRFGSDFKMRFRAEVAVLQRKLLELQQTQATKKQHGDFKDALLPSKGLVGPPPGLPEPSFAGLPEPSFVGPPPGLLRLPSFARQTSEEPEPLMQCVLSALQQKDPFAPQTRLSAGSVGHPHACGNACRYFKRKAGCRDGSQCTDCHLCHWQRAPMPKMPAPQVAPQQSAPGLFEFEGCFPCNVETAPASALLAGSTPGGPPFGAEGPDASEAAMETCPSVGTIGHPYTCGNACKYARKQKGCKDGKLCVCCHLCVWRRYNNNTGAPQDAHASAPRVL